MNKLAHERFRTDAIDWLFVTNRLENIVRCRVSKPRIPSLHFTQLFDIAGESRLCFLEISPDLNQTVNPGVVKTFKSCLPLHPPPDQLSVRRNAAAACETQEIHSECVKDHVAKRGRDTNFALIDVLLTGGVFFCFDLSLYSSEVNRCGNVLSDRQLKRGCNDIGRLVTHKIVELFWQQILFELQRVE